MAMRDIELKSAMNRRTFLANSAGAGLVMSLGVVLPGCGSDEVTTDVARNAASRRFAPTVWFEIDGDGGILRRSFQQPLSKRCPSLALNPLRPCGVAETGD